MNAQIDHTRKALKAAGLTPAQVNPQYERGNLVKTLTPLINALGGRITDATACAVTVRINNSFTNSASTFGGLVAGLVGRDGTVSTAMSARTVSIDFEGGVLSVRI